MQVGAQQQGDEGTDRDDDAGQDPGADLEGPSRRAVLPRHGSA